MPLKEAKLDNGLQVYVDHIPGSRVNNVTMVVPFGSVNEQEGEEGVAHVFEHCTDLETDDFEREGLDRYVRLQGSTTNASTGYTTTSYYANGKHLETNFYYLSQILQRTHFPKKAVKHELKAIRRELITDLDEIEELHRLTADYARFGVPYGRSVGGYHDRINFSVDELKDLHRKYYKLGHMSLVVTGLANLDEVATLANRYFEDDGSSNVSMGMPDLPLTMGEHGDTGFIVPHSQNVRLAVSHPTDENFRHLYLKNDLAFDTARIAMSEACFNMLRYDKGVSYDGGLSFDAYNHPNAWSICGDVTVDADKVSTAKDIFRTVLEMPGKSYKSDSILGSLALYDYSFNAAINSQDASMSQLLGSLDQYEAPEDRRTTMRRLDKLTEADVRSAIDAISEYWQQTPEYTHVTGSRKAIGKSVCVIERDSVA